MEQQDVNKIFVYNMKLLENGYLNMLHNKFHKKYNSLVGYSNSVVFLTVFSDSVFNATTRGSLSSKCMRVIFFTFLSGSFFHSYIYSFTIVALVSCSCVIRECCRQFLYPVVPSSCFRLSTDTASYKESYFSCPLIGAV